MNSLSKLIADFKQYAELTALGITTPTNCATEQQLFIESAKNGRLYSPNFEYSTQEYEKAVKTKAKLPTFIDALDNMINEQNGPQRFAYDLIRCATEQQLMLCDVAISIHEHDDAKTKTLLAAYYGTVSNELLGLANCVSKGGSIPNHLLDKTAQILAPDQAQFYKRQKMGPGEIKRVFETALDIYNLNNEWSVVINNSRSNITVRVHDEDRHHIIVIPTMREVSTIKAVQLAMHEIATHVRHNTNCYSILMDECGLSEADASLLVELALQSPYTEGLAKVADAIAYKACFGNDSGAPHPWHVLAVNMASEGANFVDVVDYLLRQHKSIQESWKIVLRAFRGSSNLHTNPYGFANPSGITYLRDYSESIQDYENPAVFNYAKFNPETIRAHDRVSKTPLSEVKPRIAHQPNDLATLLNEFCPD